MTHVLIIVENLPVPLDRRVWQQATALVRAGFAVSVICPKAGKHVAAFDELEGVRIYRHGLPVEGKGRTRALSALGRTRRAEGFWPHARRVTVMSHRHTSARSP